MSVDGHIRRHNGIAPKLGERVYVDRAAVVCGNVALGDDASVWPSTVLRGDLLPITIGARTSVQDGSIVHTSHDGPYTPGGKATSVGSDVTIGHSVTLHGCTIRDRVLVGIGSIVLDGSVIESDVMIGAGSLVPPGKTLESGYLYVGSPCRQARPLTDDERGYFTYTAGYYVGLKNQHLAEV